MVKLIKFTMEDLFSRLLLGFAYNHIHINYRLPDFLISRFVNGLFFWISYV